MLAQLPGLLLALDSADSRVLAGWKRLFDLELAAAHGLPANTVADLSLEAVVTNDFPALPQIPPLYDEMPRSSRRGRVRYYETATGSVLDPVHEAQVHFHHGAERVELYLADTLLDGGNLEDLTLIALEHALRLHGLYFVHAFAVARESAVLLCGPSGSGKTTTGLALLKYGWRFLANDVTLIRAHNSDVIAFPSPGTINVQQGTLQILPELQAKLPPGAASHATPKVVLPRGDLLDSSMLSLPVPVRTILFPRLGDHLRLEQLAPALGLARLIAESADRWHQPSYERHVDLLAHLSRGASAYDLILPHNKLDQLAELDKALNDF